MKKTKCELIADILIATIFGLILGYFLVLWWC